jgi:hypothetical protein
VVGELTGAAATGGEGLWRRRKVVSATGERKKVGEGFGSPETGGDLRSGRGRQARLRARERGRCCLGGRGRCCATFQSRTVAFYRREREHEGWSRADRTPCVSAVGGARRGSSETWACPAVLG